VSACTLPATVIMLKVDWTTVTALPASAEIHCGTSTGVDNVACAKKAANATESLFLLESRNVVVKIVFVMEGPRPQKRQKSHLPENKFI